MSLGNGLLFSNTSGNNNVAIGRTSLGQNTIGTNNTAIGNGSSSNNTTGNENISLGYISLYSNTTGLRNIALGSLSAYNISSGSQNIAIGYNAYLTGNYTNSTALGANTSISASNQIRLGNTSIGSIGGQVGWSSTSDTSNKENIKDNVEGLNFIMGLEPRTYNFNVRKLDLFQANTDSLRSNEKYQELYQTRHVGFLAQDVEALADRLNFDFHAIDKPKNPKGIYRLRYSEFVVPIVKAMQEQQSIIDNQKSTIETLLKKLEEMEEYINK